MDSRLGGESIGYDLKHGWVDAIILAIAIAMQDALADFHRQARGKGETVLHRIIFDAGKERLDEGQKLGEIQINTLPKGSQRKERSK